MHVLQLQYLKASYRIFIFHLDWTFGFEFQTGNPITGTGIRYPRKHWQLHIRSTQHHLKENPIRCYITYHMWWYQGNPYFLSVKICLSSLVGFYTKSGIQWNYNFRYSSSSYCAVTWVEMLLLISRPCDGKVWICYKRQRWKYPIRTRYGVWH